MWLCLCGACGFPRSPALSALWRCRFLRVEDIKTVKASVFISSLSMLAKMMYTKVKQEHKEKTMIEEPHMEQCRIKNEDNKVKFEDSYGTRHGLSRFFDGSFHYSTCRFFVCQVIFPDVVGKLGQSGKTWATRAQGLHQTFRLTLQS